MAKSGRIHIGIGGWLYEPWRGVFYPERLPQKRELEYASRQLTAIEINSTFYRPQPASTFARWRDETPDGFRFAVKAPRYATHRRTLADAREAVNRFLSGGVMALGDKLGPLLWQLPPAKRFDAEDLERFLALLPSQSGVRHAVEARHQSFLDARYVELARRHGVATVYTDSSDYPSYADVTGDFVYARLMRSRPDIETGYAPAELDAWAERARAWSLGAEPEGLPRIDAAKVPRKRRDVYVFLIDGAKERAPGAAKALIARL